MSFETVTKPSEAIEETRNIIRACLPESDAWKLNVFDIMARVMGGVAWTALNLARRGADAYLDPAKQEGQALDRYAAQPCIGLARLPESPAVGTIRVAASAALIPAGTVFTDSCGTAFTSTEDAFSVGDIITVPVVSALSGAAVNSPVNQPLEWAGEGHAFSNGIYGGADVECDADFLLRIYAARRKTLFFGSTGSIIDVLLGEPGVSRAFEYEDGMVVMIGVVMEGTYPCGTATEADLDGFRAMFEDECLQGFCGPPCLSAVESRTLAPEITWTKPPQDICAIQKAMQDWLRANYGFGDAVSGCDIAVFLKTHFPEYGPVLDACKDWPSFCGIWNCVELVGCD